MALDLSRRMAGSCAAAAMLSGCGGAQPTIGAPGAMPQGAATASARAQKTPFSISLSWFKRAARSTISSSQLRLETCASGTASTRNSEGSPQGSKSQRERRWARRI